MPTLTNGDAVYICSPKSTLCSFGEVFDTCDDVIVGVLLRGKMRLMNCKEAYWKERATLFFKNLKMGFGRTSSKMQCVEDDV